MARRYVWFTRSTIHPHRIDMAIIGIHRYATRLNGVPFTYALYVNEGAKLRWAWDAAEVERLGKRILRQCSSPVGLRRHMKLLERYRQKALRATQPILDLTSKQLSVKKIIYLYDWLLDRVTAAHGLLDADVDAVDELADAHLRAVLSKFLKKLSPTEFEVAYQKLVAPTQISYTAQERLDVLKVTLGARKINQAAQILERKYWWTSLGWESTRVNDVGHYISELKLLHHSRKSAQRELFQLRKQHIINRRTRNRLIQKNHLPKVAVHWLSFVDAYAKIHDQRKEMQVKTLYAFHTLLKQAARILHIAVRDLEWLRLNEVQEALRKSKVDMKLISRRKKLLCIEATRSGIRVLAGANARRARAKAMRGTSAQVTTLKGTPVSAGIVKGVVRVCHGSVDALKKVRVGDILVCGMTLPDVLPAMKRAAAIVTDEGGTTSHAAIIARELKKPCIVGTKIATGILKDGDKVLVDANTGKVKKI